MVGGWKAFIAIGKEGAWLYRCKRSLTRCQTRLDDAVGWQDGFAGVTRRMGNAAASENSTVMVGERGARRARLGIAVAGRGTRARAGMHGRREKERGCGRGGGEARSHRTRMPTRRWNTERATGAGREDMAGSQQLERARLFALTMSFRDMADAASGDPRQVSSLITRDWELLPRDAVILRFNRYPHSLLQSPRTVESPAHPPHSAA